MIALKPATASFLLGLGKAWVCIIQVGDGLEVVRQLNYKEFEFGMVG